MHICVCLSTLNNSIMNAEPGLVAVIRILDKFVQVTSTNHSSNFANTYAGIVFPSIFYYVIFLGKQKLYLAQPKKKPNHYMLHICMYIYNTYVIKVVRLEYFCSTQNRMFLSCVEVL